MPLEPSTAPPPQAAEVFARVAARYRHASRFTRFYVRGKLRGDVVHRDVLALAAERSFGEVVDIGCGRGQLGIALLEAGLCTRVLGLDRDFARLAEAGRAAAGLRFSALGADLSQPIALPPADTMLLIDVLYQLPTAAQEALLARAAARSRRLIVRTMDPTLPTRGGMALGFERRFRWILPNSGTYVNPQPVTWITDLLASQGMVVAARPCGVRPPFANILIDARRDAA